MMYGGFISVYPTLICEIQTKLMLLDMRVICFSRLRISMGNAFLLNVMSSLLHRFL